MKQIEFNLLSKEEQIETLSQLGFVIGMRKDKKYSYVFYCLDEFFVEAKLEKDVVKSMQSFAGTHQLSLYTHNVLMQLKHAS
jgi:hypothetical protein